MTLRDLLLYHYHGYEIHVDLHSLEYSCQLPGQPPSELTGYRTEQQCQDAIDALLEGETSEPETSPTPI